MLPMPINYVCFNFLTTGSPREYLEAYVFPVLLPAIEQMLIAAKENKVFEVCLSQLFCTQHRCIVQSIHCLRKITTILLVFESFSCTYCIIYLVLFGMNGPSIYYYYY